jgi:hypothetical protein
VTQFGSPDWIVFVVAFIRLGRRRRTRLPTAELCVCFRRRNDVIEIDSRRRVGLIERAEIRLARIRPVAQMVHAECGHERRYARGLVAVRRAVVPVVHVDADGVNECRGRARGLRRKGVMRGREAAAAAFVCEVDALVDALGKELLPPAHPVTSNPRESEINPTVERGVADIYPDSMLGTSTSADVRGAHPSRPCLLEQKPGRKRAHVRLWEPSPIDGAMRSAAVRNRRNRPSRVTSPRMRPTTATKTKRIQGVPTGKQP